MGLTTVPYAPGAFGRDVNVPAGLCNIFLCLFMVGRLMKVFGKHICWWMAFVAVLWGVTFMLAGCKHVDDDRTPPAGVWIVFATEPEWTNMVCLRLLTIGSSSFRKGFQPVSPTRR